MTEDLKKVRRLLGFPTQQAWADHIGYSREEVSRWESGHKSPPRLMLLYQQALLRELQATAIAKPSAAA